jgi:hypothetical protein
MDTFEIALAHMRGEAALKGEALRQIENALPRATRGTMDISEAMFSSSFPVNPIPFANGLANYVRENGTDSIQSDQAKRILWVLMAQAYGQLGEINLGDEWQRLANADGFKHGARYPLARG